MLEKDFVLVKVDDVRDVNGREIAERLTRGRSVGVPFHAIFDPNEKKITDKEKMILISVKNALFFWILYLVRGTRAVPLLRGSIFLTISRMALLNSLVSLAIFEIFLWEKMTVV